MEATSHCQLHFSTDTRHDPAGDKYCSIRAACERSISHHLSPDAATNSWAVCYRMQRSESGETSRGSCRSCLSANASGRIWDVCGDTCSPAEVRWRFVRNLTDTGRHCESACCASCSHEGSGSRGDHFRKSTFIRALNRSWATILDHSAIS